MGLIKDDLELDKDVRSGNYLTPRQYRKNMYTHLAELEKAFRPQLQRQLKQKITGLEASQRKEEPEGSPLQVRVDPDSKQTF